jgi:hypothetical protein
MFSGGLRRRWRDPDGMIHEWEPVPYAAPDATP